jgi:hypothetical protein
MITLGFMLYLRQGFMTLTANEHLASAKKGIIVGDISRYCQVDTCSLTTAHKKIIACSAEIENETDACDAPFVEKPGGKRFDFLVHVL